MKLEPQQYFHLMALAHTARSFNEAARRADDEYQVEMRRHGLDPLATHRFNHSTFEIEPIASNPPASPTPAPPKVTRPRRFK